MQGKQILFENDSREFRTFYNFHNDFEQTEFGNSKKIHMTEGQTQ